jgi:hypothetical protein
VLYASKSAWAWLKRRQRLDEHFVSNLDLNPYSEDMTAGHVRPTVQEAALIKVAYPFTQSEFAIHMSAAANRVAFH